MPHCPVTVVQRYRDGVYSLLFYLFCHPYIPLHLEEMIFYTCIFIYTTEAEALSVAHARIVYLTREIRSVVYGRNAEYLPVSRIKMGDYRAHVNTGTLQLSSKQRQKQDKKKTTKKQNKKNYIIPSVQAE